MADWKIKCEVFSIDGGCKICPGSAKMKKGQAFLIGSRTPEPEGVCARSFASIYPVAMAMRFFDEIPWERGNGFFDVTCPDACVVFRLSREGAS